MNVLDDTENENGIPADDEEDEFEKFHAEEDAMLDKESDDAALESEDEAGAAEVRGWFALQLLTFLNYSFDPLTN